MIHYKNCQALSLGDQYCNCKYRFQEATLRTMTRTKRKMTIAIFARYFREKFLARLAIKEQWDRHEVERTFDDTIRDALLEELERRDNLDNKGE